MRRVKIVVGSLGCAVAVLFAVFYVVMGVLFEGNAPADPDYDFAFAMQAWVATVYGLVSGSVAAIAAFVVSFFYFRRRFPA